jgi:hypothetical protein
MDNADNDDQFEIMFPETLLRWVAGFSFINYHCRLEHFFAGLLSATEEFGDPRFIDFILAARW